MFRMEALLKRVTLTTSRLAKLARVHRNTLAYADAESPNRRNLTPATLRKVASALDTHAAVLTQEAQRLRTEADLRSPPPPIQLAVFLRSS